MSQIVYSLLKRSFRSSSSSADLMERQHLNNSKCYKTDYVTQVIPDVIKDPITGSKDTAFLANCLNFACWWSCIGEGLLQMGQPHLVPSL